MKIVVNRWLWYVLVLSCVTGMAGCNLIQQIFQEDDAGLLQDVDIEGIPMSLSFNPATLTYAGECAYERPSLFITPTLEDSTQSVAINGVKVHSGQRFLLPLTVGANHITFEDAAKTYELTVHRKSVAEQLNTCCPDYPLPGYYDGSIDSTTKSEALVVTEDYLENFNPYLSGTLADSWVFDIDVGDGWTVQDTWVRGFGYTVAGIAPFLFMQDVNSPTLVMGGGTLDEPANDPPILWNYFSPLPLVVSGQAIQYKGVVLAVHVSNLLPVWNHGVASYHKLYSSLPQAVSYRSPDGSIPVKDLPRLRQIRYWQCIKTVVIGTGSTKFEETVQYGVTETDTELFMEATVGVDADPLDFLDGSADFLDITVNGRMHEVSLSRFDETTHEELASSVPGALSTTAVLWQLVEELQIVDSEGELFDDPFYHIDQEKTKTRLVNKLKTFAISTVPQY